MTKLRYENIDRERIRVFADDGSDRVAVGEITVHQYMRLRSGAFFKVWRFGGQDYARRSDAGWAALRAHTKENAQ